MIGSRWIWKSPPKCNCADGDYEQRLTELEGKVGALYHELGYVFADWQLHKIKLNKEDR